MRKGLTERETIEKLKTVTLTVLVAASLLLSLGIWRTGPQFEAIDGPQFAANGVTDPIFQRTLSAIASPRLTVLHYGENKHTVLFPGESGYLDALELLRNASFFDMRITTDYGEDEWQNIVNKGQSLQFEFDSILSGATLEQSELINFTSSVEPAMQGKTLYLFRAAEDNDWRGLFYGGPDQRTYISRVVLPTDRQVKLFDSLKDNTAYELFGKSLHKNFYLPAKREKLTRYAAEVGPGVIAERLIDTFFLDRSLTRSVYERDGSQIVTDGSRSVRVGSKDHMIIYRNLGLDKRRPPQLDIDSGVLRALNFVNEHGGFLGQPIVLHEVRNIPGARNTEGRIYEFRQHVHGLPVLSELSSIYVRVADQEVGGMKRSQFALGKPYRLDELEILSGAELLALIDKSGLLIDRNRITDAYLAYLAGEPSDQMADLQPVYVVEQASDRRTAIFDAATGEQLRSEEGDYSGLE